MTGNSLARRRLITVVCNQKSGGGRAGNALPKVLDRLRRGISDAELHVVASSTYEEARDLTRSAALTAQPGDVIAVMGGDGMAHLGLNACAGTEATMAVIPAGTGNDFARGAGIPGTIHESVEALVRGKTRVIDLSRLTNATGSRHIGAVVSTGYDARVNRATNDMRLRLGALSYGFVALRELASFSPMKYRITVDGQYREVEAMLIAVANLGIFGGGMHVAPDFDAADGLLDITIVGAASRGKLLRLLPAFYSGRFVNDPVVERLQARRVEIDGNDMFVMGDGEEMGPVPAVVEIEPGALRVIVA